MSYNHRKDLRRSLLEKEFTDDYSLNPKVTRQGRDFGPQAEQLLTTVTSKRHDTTIRHDTLEQARLQTAKLDPLKLLEDAIKAAGHENDDAEYEAMMDRYSRGDHILRNKAKEEMADAELESKMYTDAANIFTESKTMSDYATQKIGDVVLPPVTQHYANSLNRSTKYIKNMKDRMYLDTKLRQCKATVAELREAIDKKEKEIAEVTVSIEQNERVGDFDWQLDMNRKVRGLVGYLDVDKEDLLHAQSELKKTEETIAKKYPDMSAQMSLGVLDQQSKIVAKEGTDPFDETNLTCINAAGEEVNLVYGWLLGKLTPKGQVSTMLFGQFTQKTVPPKRGWNFIGANVKMDDALQKAREDEGKATGVPEDFMLQTQHDKLRIKNVKSAVLTTEIETGKKIITQRLAVIVKGCTHNEVNGRYLEQGFMNNSNIFVNVNGWSLTRQQRQEIPEMDIYADGCYAPATLESGAESVSARMNNRTASVMDELMQTQKDGASGLQEGSAAFKRRFAELARVGNRMVVADHQHDMMHTENIKAESRVQSDEEMLLRIAMTTKKMATDQDLTTTLNGVEEGDEEWDEELSDDEDVDVEKKETEVEEVISLASRRSSQQSEESTIIDEGRMLPPDTIMPDGFLFETDLLNKTTKKAAKKQKALPKTFRRSKTNKSNTPDNNTARAGSLIKPAPTAAESSAQFLITQATKTGKPVESYNNLDFKVLTSKNIQSQLGSQGFHHISKKTKDHVEEEADLSVVVMQTIEAREDVLYQLKIEAADVQNRYITSDERSNIVDNEKALARMIEILDDLRHCTIRTAEAIGAWARQASRLQDKEKTEKNYLSAVDLNKSNRKYAVVLSIKGAELYPQSEGMQYTNNRRFRRGLETAQSSLEVKYVGVFDTKDEACQAFVEAAASVPIEQRYAPYVGMAPKMFIGLRQCGNHYMVRSVGVPPDLPCEQCGASKASNFKQFIPQATGKLFPQFLFHGENYLDKMWIDTQFLGTVMLMNHYFGKFDCFMNPLQLTKNKIQQVMENIIVFASDLKQDKDGLAGYIDVKPLNNLRGKYERFRVASEDAIKRGQRPKEVTIDGIAYRFPGKRPDLDSDKFQPKIKKFMSIDRHFLDQVEAQELKKALEDKTNANISLNLNNFSFGNGNPSTFSELTNGEDDFKYTTSVAGDEDKTTDSVNQSISNAFQDRLRRAMSRLGEDVDDLDSRPSAVLQKLDNSAGEVSLQRLQRAMVILGQSQALNNNFFKAQIVKNENEMPSAGTMKVSGSTSTFAATNKQQLGASSNRMMSKSAGGMRQKRGRNMDEVVETVVQYTYFGAQLKTVQMRPKVAHRVDNVWVRSDQGEWYGTQTKGRHMKRFDRIERIVQEGKKRQEDRAELSRLITKALEFDFVEGDADHVKYIKTLIEKSAKHKGSVLDLDVLKAEKYIKDRKDFILAVRFVQRCFRGYSMRVYAWHLREQRRIMRIKMVLLDTEAAKLAESFVSTMLSEVVATQTKVLAAKQFQVASIFGGVPMVVSVYARPRGISRSQNLCIGCQMRSQRTKYNPSKRKKYNDTSPCYESDRYPCTCTMIQGQESWLIEVYDPVSCKKYFKNFTAQQIQHYVFRTYYESQKLNDLLYHKHMLYGKGFGAMQPLFAPDSKSEYGSAYFESEGKFKMDAAKEYAVLGAVPRSYSSHMMYGMTHYKLTPELADVYASHLLRNIKRPIVVQNVERCGGIFLPDDTPDEVAWQPIEDVLYAKHQFEHIKLIAPVMEKYMFKTRVEWEESRDLLHDHLVGRFEQSSMEYEDIRSILYSNECKLRDAEALVKDVMQFSLSGLEKIEAEERGEREDWNQAWEGLEDASRWQNLNNARKFKVKLANTQDEFNAKVKLHQGVLDDHANLVAEEDRRHQLVNGDRTKIEALYKFLGQTQDCVLSIRKIALEALHVLVSAMIIPSQNSLKSDRKLKFPTTVLPYIREPAKRGQIDYRSGWNVIARKFMVLKPLDAVGIHHLRRNKKPKQEKVRCVVTIYKDTLFNNYIVSVRTSDDKEVKTEENAMHLDFDRKKSDYSNFTAHTQDNEIMISQEYIDEFLFAKPFNWPENRLQQRIEDENLFFDEIEEITRQETPVVSSEIGNIEVFDDATPSRPSSRGTSRRSTRQRHPLSQSNVQNDTHGSGAPSSMPTSRLPSRHNSRPSSAYQHDGKRSRAATRPNSKSTSSRPSSGMHNENIPKLRPTTGGMGGEPTHTRGSSRASSRPPSSGQQISIKSSVSTDAEPTSVSTNKAGSKVTSRAGSRAGSRVGSRSGSCAGSRPESRVLTRPSSAQVLSSSDQDDIVDPTTVEDTAKIVANALLKSVGSITDNDSVAIEKSVDDGSITHEQVIPQFSVKVVPIIYNKLACRSAPKGGYHSRHQRQAAEQEEILAKLIKYLHLHPHTLRPCLGLLPFHRRRDCIKSIADRTIWYRDMIRKSNTSWLYSEFCKDKTAVVCQREFVATMRDSYGEISLRLRTPFGGKEFGAFESEVVIPFKNIIKSMVSKPLLLASFLCETITNTYSDDLIKHVLGNIDLILPGEEHRWWRRVLTKEKTPAIEYIVEESKKFRGPIFFANKFVSGKYCSVKIYTSATFDLKFVFSSPQDGLFWFQALKPGNEVTAILSIDAIKSFLLKKSSSPNISEEERNFILKLHHPMHMHGMIHFLLKNMDLKEKIILKKYYYDDEDSGIQKPFIDSSRNNTRLDRGDGDSDCESEASGSPSLHGFDVGDSECLSDLSDDDCVAEGINEEGNSIAPDENGIEEEVKAQEKVDMQDDLIEEVHIEVQASALEQTVEGIIGDIDEDAGSIDQLQQDRRMLALTWRQRLRVKVWKCIKKFNMWVEQYKINITPLSSKFIAEIYTNLREYECPPEWSLKDKDVGEGSEQPVDTLTVYDGFWATVDPRLVVRKPVRIDTDYLALNSASVYSTSLVIDPNTGFNNYKLPAPEIVFQGEAYYRVKVGTDAYKSHVKVDVHETEFTDPTAEMEVHRIECEKMMLEDDASRASAELEVEMMLLRDEARIRASTPAIPPEYIAHLVKARDRSDALKVQLRRIQHQFLPMIDGIWDKVALNCFALTTNTLAVSFDENKNQVFHIDEVAIAAKCKKFARFSDKDPKVRPTLSFFDSIKPSAMRKAERKARRTVKKERSIVEIATENERITEEMQKWLCNILEELRDTKDIVAQPSIAFQQSGVSTKAYPGVGAPRTATMVDGLTSSDGVNEVMSYQPTPFHVNTYRTNESWKRIRPLRHWELGNLVSLDSDYLRRARRGTKPHYIRHKGRVFMVSAPNIGPADRASVSVYSPGTGDSMVVGYKSNMKVPFIRGLKYFEDRDIYEDGGSNDDDDSTVIETKTVENFSDNESDLPSNLDSDSDSDEEMEDTFPFESGIIRITKIECVNLRSVVMVGKNDPFVTLTYGNHLHTETPVAKGGGSDASWVVDPESVDVFGKESPEGSINIKVKPDELTALELHVEVMNSNKLSKPSQIGAGKVPLGVYLTNKRWEDKLAVIQLSDSKHRDAGEIHVHFEFIEKLAPLRADQDPELILIREAAERIVWRSMVNGITVAAVRAAEVKIDKAYEALEAQVAEKCVPWFRHMHQITVVDRAGNLEYSSVIERKRTFEEKVAVLNSPAHRQLIPSATVATKTAYQDTHLRKLVMKKFAPRDFKRKVSLMYLDPTPPPPPPVRTVDNTLYGLFVPADEDSFPIPFVSISGAEWMEKCHNFLGSAGDSFASKYFTFPVIVYTKRSSDEAENQQPVVNLKLSKFVFEYIMQVGWRKNGDYISHKKNLSHEMSHRNNFNEFDASPTIHGDAVVLFRHGETDFELMQKWCQQRHVERLEMLERRRLRELHEHQMRVNKFKLWRSDIFCIAAKYGPLMEKYFYRDYTAIKFIPENGPFNSNFEITEDGQVRTNSYVGCIVQNTDFFAKYDNLKYRHLRILFLRFTELLKSHPKEMRHSIQMMDQDYAFFNDEREYIFESYDRLAFIDGEEFLKFQWNTFHDPRNLQYQTGHILYALYLGHCEHCCVIPGTCPIPGCNIIRQMAQGQSHEYGLQHNSDGQNDFLALRGCGYHPLELATKKYLLEMTTFDKIFVMPTLRSPVVEVFTSEVSSESTEFTRKALTKKSKRWRRQIEEAKKFRYLNRRVIKPSWRSYLTAEEVHEAKGGHDDHEEKLMTYMDNVKLSFYLPSPGADAMMESAYLYEEESMARTAVESSVLNSTVAGATMTVSTLAVRRMMGIHDDNVKSFDVCSYDPAPSRDDLLRSWRKDGLDADVMENNKNCMATELFQWLLKHVRVQRETLPFDPVDSIVGTGNSELATAYDYYVSKLNDESLLHAGEQRLMFDRKQAQGVVQSKDNTLLFIQVLQGVSEGAMKRQNQQTGRPEAAQRFVTGEEMSALSEGLTVSVHHIGSDVTICLVIQDRKLDILADNYKVPRRNFPLIAEALLSNAVELVHIHEADGIMKDVTLAIRLKAEAPKKCLRMKTPLQDKYKHTSRRYGAVSKQKGRVGSAAFLLDMLECEGERGAV